jgi:NAD(P)-dependent dehydrogenase (short-subunit alcohol dehydrogenase family)
MKKIFLTKVRPGSISDAIKHYFSLEGWELQIAPDDWDIRQNNTLIDRDCTVMINTAGVTDTATPMDWNFERANQVIGVNLSGAISLTSEFIRATQGTKKLKTIVHIGSLWSRKHSTNSPVYTASKAGLAHYIACMGYELNLHYPGEYTIIGVHPGNVWGTPLTQRVQRSLREGRGFSPEQIEELYKGAITPLEIASIVDGMIGKPLAQWGEHLSRERR